MTTTNITALALNVIDAQIEFNTKMMIIFTLLFYSIILFAFTYFIERYDPTWNEDSSDARISRLLLKRLYRWMSGAYIFIFNLMFLFGFRGAKLEDLLQLVYGLYIVFFGAFIVWGVMYAWDIVLISTKLKKDNTRNRGYSRK